MRNSPFDTLALLTDRALHLEAIAKAATIATIRVFRTRAGTEDH